MAPTEVLGPAASAALPDFSDDFSYPSTEPAIQTAVTGSSTGRTLLLCPPSLSSHPDALNSLVSQHDRASTDFQMIDRLSEGVIKLAEGKYKSVTILPGADGSNTETSKLLSNRAVLRQLAAALIPGGVLSYKDGAFTAAEKKEGVLEGLSESANGALVKPKEAEAVSVPLRLGKRKNVGAAVAIDTNGAVPLNGSNGTNGTTNGVSNGIKTTPAGVGFIDVDDDLNAPVEIDDEDDDELIDEDTLLDEADLARPIVQPPECRPKPGKRRRACKDCTCGLAERLEAEDKAKRDQADKDLSTLDSKPAASVPKFSADDLNDAELDFTVQGKVGSCGNCALGDAFRCDGCPYIGLPAFKPGEEVRLRAGDEGTV